MNKKEPKRRDITSEKGLKKDYTKLVRGLMTGRPHCVEIGPESLKLTKLTETGDIEASLTTFERAIEAHGVERDKEQ